LSSKPPSLKVLTIDQVLEIHERVCGSRTASLRDRGLLESAVAAPFQTFDGEDLYPTIFEKAAALMRSLAQNQPFTDGNKRTAWMAAWTFLWANGLHLRTTPEDAQYIMLRLADGSLTVEDLAYLLADKVTVRPS
jgi:death-on-curing protein